MELQYCARIHGLGMYLPVGNTRHSGNSGFPFSENQANRKFWTFWKFQVSVLGKPGKPEILDVF